MIPPLDPPDWLRRWWLRRAVSALADVEAGGIWKATLLPMLAILACAPLVAALVAAQAALGLSNPAFVPLALLPAAPVVLWSMGLFRGWGQPIEALLLGATRHAPATGRRRIEAFALRRRFEAELAAWR